MEAQTRVFEHVGPSVEPLLGVRAHFMFHLADLLKGGCAPTNALPGGTVNGEESRIQDL